MLVNALLMLSVILPLTCVAASSIAQQPKPLVILQAGLNAPNGPRVFPKVIVYDSGLVIYSRLTAAQLYNGGANLPYLQTQLTPSDLKSLMDSLKINDKFFKASSGHGALGIDLYSVTVWQAGRTKTVTAEGDIFGETLAGSLLPSEYNSDMLVKQSRDGISKEFLRVADILYRFDPGSDSTEFPAPGYYLTLSRSDQGAAISWPPDLSALNAALPSDNDIVIRGQPQSVPISPAAYRRLQSAFSGARASSLMLDGRKWAATFTCSNYFPGQELWSH